MTKSAGTQTRLTLPFPDSRLSPNNRRAHRWLTDVRNIARNTGYYAALDAGLCIPDRTPLHLWLTFSPPDNRRRDVDNLLSASKSTLDGIFKALHVDDCNVKLTTLEMGKRVKGGQMTVMIEPIQKGK
jgi:crossover junction endodeoxyribonuclease RusA